MRVLSGCELWVCVDVLEGDNQTELLLRSSGPLPAVTGLPGDTAGSSQWWPHREPLLTQGRLQTQSRDTQVCWAGGGNLDKESEEMLPLQSPGRRLFCWQRAGTH